MAVSGISQSFAAVGAYHNSQAQAFDAQSNPLATLQHKDAGAPAQLSAAGRIQSSLANLQTNAQALSTISQSTPPGELATLVNGVVQSFNNLNRTVSDVSSQPSGGSSGNAQPVQALNAINHALAGADDASVGALQKLGLVRQSDGSLSTNQIALDKSFQANPSGTSTTLARAAGRIDHAVSQQLAAGASAATTSKASSTQVTPAESTRSSDQAQQNKQLQMEKQKVQQQYLAAQLANTGGYAARNAVTTYFNVATL
jgi:hypothetical protein